MRSPELPQSEEVVLSVVPVDGQPIWQACAGGRCARSRSGSLALQLLRALLNRRPGGDA